MTDKTDQDGTLQSVKSREGLQRALISWFARVGESYPWRETSDPYAILVSELMLQQTRIATVLDRGYFTRWIRQFPNWAALANASEESVLKAWEGLGYYNRARNLQKTAQVIVEDYDGSFPRKLDKVLALPGVGKYTAGAVLSFAFNLPVPILDGNVIRVLSRIFGFRESVTSTGGTRQLWEWAEALTPEAGARHYNSAIMELGQKLCRKTSPLCKECPVETFCKAGPGGFAEELPVKTKKPTITKKEECAFILKKGGLVWLSQESGPRRKGLWRLPEAKKDEVADLSELFRFDYAITRFRVTLRVFEKEASFLSEDEEKSGTWISLDSPETWPALGSPYKKALLKFTDFHNDLLGKESFNE